MRPGSRDFDHRRAIDAGQQRAAEELALFLEHRLPFALAVGGLLGPLGAQEHEIALQRVVDAGRGIRPRDGRFAALGDDRKDRIVGVPHEPGRTRDAAAHELRDLGPEHEAVAIEVGLPRKGIDHCLGEGIVGIGHGLAGAAGSEDQPGIVCEKIERPLGRLGAQRVAHPARHAIFRGARGGRQHRRRETGVEKEEHMLRGEAAQGDVELVNREAVLDPAV